VFENRRTIRNLDSRGITKLERAIAKSHSVRPSVCPLQSRLNYPYSVQNIDILSHRVTAMFLVSRTSAVSICRRTGNGRLPTPVLHPETRCLTISRTLIFLFKLSNVILRHSSFPHTSTFSAFEVSYKNALYKFTVIIIIIS